MDKALLGKLHKFIIFKRIDFPDIYKNILEDKKTKKWGIYNIVKLFGFNLVKEYEKVLLLDADLLINKDISKLFDIEEEIAWRKVIGWNPQQNFKSLLEYNNDYISACNGGVILFTNKLNKYNITDSDVVSAYDVIKNLKRGGLDENITAYLVYKNRIKLKELDISFNCPAAWCTPDKNENLRFIKVLNSKNILNCYDNLKETAKIIHLVDSRGISTKPWRSLSAYLYFRDWAENYEAWISMGGSGSISFTENDYYDLFAFKQADEIKKMKNKLKQKDEELEKLKNISRKYNIISNSKTWKATKPIRKILDVIKKLK